MEHEKSIQFKSRLQPPSANPLETSKLTELSEASQNVRAKSSMQPPPSHGIKRKTLVEQAVEYIRPAPPAPGSRLPAMACKVGSISSLSRPNPATASSSRSNSAASTRTTSNSSNFSQSLGPSRIHGGQAFRAGSSISAYQTIPRTNKVGHRPASALDSTVEDSIAMGNGQTINSMRQFSSSTHSTVRNIKPSKPIVVSPSEHHTSPQPSSSLRVVKRHGKRVRSLREISISTRLGNLSLQDDRLLKQEVDSGESIKSTNSLPQTPSQIPKKKHPPPATQRASSRTPSPSKSSRKKAPPIGGFLTIDSNIKCADWDVNDRLDKMETMYADMKAALDGSTDERDGLKETLALLKTRNTELEMDLLNLKRTCTDLQRVTDDERNQKVAIQLTLDDLTRKNLYETASLKQVIDDQKRAHNNELDDIVRQKRRDLEELRQDNEVDRKKQEAAHNEELTQLRRQLEGSLENEKEQRQRELNTLTLEGTAKQRGLESQLLEKDEKIEMLQAQLDKSKAETDLQKEIVAKVKNELSDLTTTIITLESSLRSSKARVEFLESDNKSQSQAFADLEQRTQDAIRESEEAKAKLRTEETLRRKLHNQVQELKGNIRVYCRVRPALETDEADRAQIAFPDQDEDAKEIDILGPEEKSSLGRNTTKNHTFSFDRVFSPVSQNGEIFDELSQLVQSALDGYNVCIFCYGQTGSGKTHTMSSSDGMIPKAVNQIYETSRSLRERGWEYSIEGSFVEIYNENINDLLGSAEDFDKKKHEIRHDPTRLRTTITDVQTVKLDSPGRVQQVLTRALSNRSVAATMANARSSRSHSVFIMKLSGRNSVTGEKCDGTLNLVDLAGSERLSHSGATGDRLKETQNINKSLSCLGDVISALNQGKDGSHVPYRNSKLTYLLQYSLGGNSKTLMFVMISPLQGHLSETLTSLKFATKVNNTQIGTAKKSRVKD